MVENRVLGGWTSILLYLMISLPLPTRSVLHIGVRLSLLILALAGLQQPGLAHQVSSASMVLEIETRDERWFRLTVETEVESSQDAELDDEIGPDQAARTFVESNLAVLVDEQEMPQSLVSNLVNRSDEDTPDELKRMVYETVWQGELPESGRELALYLRETADMSTILATIKNGEEQRRLQVMFGGEYSKIENIEQLSDGDPFEIVEPVSAAATQTKTDGEDSAGSVTLESLGRGLRANLGQHGLGFPLAVFVLTLLGVHRQPLVVTLGMFIVCHSLGFSLVHSGIVPGQNAYLWVATVCLLIVALDNVTPVLPAHWLRLILVAVAASALGMVMAASPQAKVLNGSFAVFLAGIYLLWVLICVVISLLKAKFTHKHIYRDWIAFPLSVLGAGIGLYVLIDSLL